MPTIFAHKKHNLNYQLKKLAKNIIMLFFIAILATIFLKACTFGSKELQPLKIGITTWPGFDIALYAQEKDLLKKRGINVEFIRFENQQDSSRAMIRGSLDGAFASLWDIMQTDPENDKPVVLMVTNISSGADGIVSKPTIKSVKELAGKKVGCKLGTVNHLILLEALKLHKIPPAQVEIVDVSNDSSVQMLEKGTIDAAVVWEPLLTQTANKIKGKVIYTTKEIDTLVIDTFSSSSRALAKKKTEFKQFILAWFDIMNLVTKQPEEVFKTVGIKLNQTAESFAQDYAGLKKGDIDLNKRMFGAQGRLQEASKEIIKLLGDDPRHGKIARQDVEFNTEIVNTAIKEWKP